MKTKLPKIIGVIRVSSVKQKITGDSPQIQKEQISKKIALDGYYPNQIEYIELVESATNINAHPFSKIIKYCEEHCNIEKIYIKSIDRFTRTGVAGYDFLKDKITKLGIQLIDVQGVIGNKRINLLDNTGFSYPWALHDVTRTSEVLAAEQAKTESSTILTRLIGSEIVYTQSGYRVRPAPYGCKNIKFPTLSNGIRVTLAENTHESIYIKTMFDLMAFTTKSEQEIVCEINKLGYKSRSRNTLDKINRGVVIGKTGEKRLTVKQLLKYISNPIYMGFTTEKWTNYKLTKIIGWEGLVTMETFNLANRGIVNVNLNYEGELELIRMGKKYYRNKITSLERFPYKPLVHCDICNKPLLASASTGKGGKSFPAYHCSRNHIRRSINASELDKNFNEYITNIVFLPKYFEELRNKFNTELENYLANSRISADILEKELMELEVKYNLACKRIQLSNSELTFKIVEEEVMELNALMRNKKLELEKLKAENNLIKTDSLDFIEKYMEHFPKNITKLPPSNKKTKLLAVIFNSNPTLDEIQNGTPELAPIFTYCTNSGNMVHLIDSEWNTILESIIVKGEEISTILKDNSYSDSESENYS